MATDSVNIPIGLDLTNFKAGVQEIGNSFQKATNTVKQSSSGAQQSIKKTTDLLIDEKSAIQDITNSIKQWEKEIKKAANPKEIENLNKKISEAKQNIAGINESTSKAKNSISAFGEHSKKVFHEIGIAIVAAFAFHAIKEFVSSSVEAYKKNEEALIALEDAYGKNKAGLEDMVASSKQFQKELNIPDEVFLNQAAFLKKQGLTNEEIKKVIKTAQGLHVSLGKDLPQTIRQLTDAFIDGKVKGLEPYGNNLSKLIKEEDGGAKVLDQLSEKYGTLAEELAGTTVGALEETALNWDNVKESMGGAVVGMLEASGAMDLINEKLILITDTLSDARLNRMEQFSLVLAGILTPGSQGAEGVQEGLNNIEAQVKGVLEKYIEARRAGNEYLTFHYQDDLLNLANSSMTANRIVTDALKDTENEILIANQKETERTKQLTEEQRKAAEERAKINEDLYKRLRQLQVENTDGFVAQLVAKRELELEDLAKVKGNEETKFQIKLEILKKYDKEFEKYSKAQTDKATELRKKEAADAIKIENERFDGIKTRLEKHAEDIQYIKNEVSAEDQNKIELANFLGIELDAKGEKKLEDFKASLKEALTLIQDYVKEALAEYTKLKEEQLAIKDEQVKENLQRIQIEQEQAEQGFNNNVTALKERDVQLQAERKKAQDELEKAKVKEITINSAMEASSMVVSIANLYKSLSGLPFGIGVAIATGLAIAMVGAFASSKQAAIKAARTTKYERGGSWVLNGPDHADGGIDLGGGREAQGRERIAIFNREATMRNSGLESFVNAINTGKLTLDKDGLGSILKPANNIVVNVSGQKELGEIKQLLADQGKTSSGRNYKRYGSTITIYKN